MFVFYFPAMTGRITKKAVVDYIVMLRRYGSLDELSNRLLAVILLF